MHIQRLKIREFRNLRDFEISFTATAKDADDIACDFKSHAVIGQNGSGKSNMIEAIVTIFRDLDLNQSTPFEYELDYWCRGNLIRVDSAAGKVNVTDGNLGVTLGIVPLEDASAEEENLSLGQGNDFKLAYLSRHAKRYLPNHVFAYYSGRNNRIEAIFQKPQDRFRNALRKGSDDLLVLNRPGAFVDGHHARYDSVVIVEFKRPMREDIGSKELPHEQALRYIKQIQLGKEEDAKGRPINAPQARFYCYLVCDLTAQLREKLNDQDFIPSPDGSGFFKASLNPMEHRFVYYEYISLDKLYEDAEKRNQALFHKLGIALDPEIEEQPRDIKDTTSTNTESLP